MIRFHTVRWLPALAAFAVAAGGCGGGMAVEEAPPPLPAAGAEQADPAVAVDPETGDLLLSWVEGDSTGHELFFARSADAGRTWSDPVRVSEARGGVHPHAEGAPRLVAAPGGVVALFWNNRIVVPGRRFAASDMRFARSVDGGRTWTAPLTLQDDTAAGPRGHTFHGAAWTGERELVVAWLDGREREGSPAALAAGHEGHATAGSSDAVVYVARSTDLGATWDDANRRMWPAACPCCRITLARGPDGAPTAAWRRHFGDGSRDVVAARFAFDAPEPVRVHEDAWKYPGCPHSGPGVAVDAAGRTHVVWYTGRNDGAGIYYARTDRGAESFAAPQPVEVGEDVPVAHPAVAALPDGRAVVAYDRGAGGERRMRFAAFEADGRPAGRGEAADSEGADHPQMAVLPDGTVVVAWAPVGDAEPRLRVVRVRAGGGR
jgi:hypothetical protein